MKFKTTTKLSLIGFAAFAQETEEGDCGGPSPHQPDPPCTRICWNFDLAGVPVEDLVSVLGLPLPLAVRVSAYVNQSGLPLFSAIDETERFSDPEIETIVARLRELDSDTFKALRAL
jgi:hypothetical protein